MEQWLIDVNNSKDLNTTKEILSAFCVANNLGAFAYTSLSPNEKTLPSTFIYNYPEEWAEYYLAHAFQHNDPILKKILTSNLPFRWSEVFSWDALSEKEHHVMQQAKIHNVSEGFTIPISDYHNNTSLTLLVEPSTPEISLEPLSLISLGHVFHQKSQSLNKCHEKKQKPEQPLSSRELECLLWTAKGKTNLEIAIILNISENTVKFHIKNIMIKYNIHNKIQAVIKAILFNEIKTHELL